MRGEDSGEKFRGQPDVAASDGRLFVFAGTEPYTRKDGSASVVLVWRGACAVCGAPFTVKTPQHLEGTKAFGRKHCDMHKLKRGLQ